MVTMNPIDRHLSSEAAPGNDPIVGEIPGGLLHAAARDGAPPRSDGRVLLLAAAMASVSPACVNRMVRRWISRQAFGTGRFSAPAE